MIQGPPGGLLSQGARIVSGVMEPGATVLVVIPEPVPWVPGFPVPIPAFWELVFCWAERPWGEASVVTTGAAYAVPFTSLMTKSLRFSMTSLPAGGIDTSSIRTEVVRSGDRASTVSCMAPLLEPQLLRLQERTGELVPGPGFAATPTFPSKPRRRSTPIGVPGDPGP